MTTSWMNDYTEFKIDPFCHDLPIITCPACGRRGKLYSNSLRVVHKYSAFIGSGKWDACDVSDQQLTECMDEYRNPSKKERKPRAKKAVSSVSEDNNEPQKKRGRPKKVETITEVYSVSEISDDIFQSALDDLFTFL